MSVLKTVYGHDSFLTDDDLVERIDLAPVVLFWRGLRHRLPEPRRRPAPVPATPPTPVGGFERWIFPVVKNMPATPLMADIVSVQPFDAPLPVYKIPAWKKAWWAVCRTRMRWQTVRQFWNFTQLYRHGDEFWHFSTDQSSWVALAGRAGYLLLRNGRIAGIWITRLS